MEEILDKIMSIGGVTGCYIYNLNKGIESRMGYPEGEELRNISKDLLQIFTAFGADDNKPRVLCVSYDKAEITIKQASEHLIVVFHTPKIDMPLLRIAINVASHIIKK